MYAKTNLAHHTIKAEITFMEHLDHRVKHQTVRINLIFQEI